MTINLNTKIADMLHAGIISVRTYNCLHSENMQTLEDVLESIDSPMDLLKIRSFGKKSYMEMLHVINNVQEEFNELNSAYNGPQFASLGQEMTAILTQAYDKALDGNDEVFAHLRSAFPDAQSMHEFVMSNSERLLDVVDGFSRKDNQRIRNVYKNYIEAVKNGMEEARITNKKIYRIYKQRLQLLEKRLVEFTYEQRAIHFLSPVAKQYMESVYQDLCNSKMSIRTRNFKNLFLPHFVDLIKYADKPLDYYRNICPGQKMKKTLTEVFRFNQNLREIFDSVSLMSDEEIRREDIKNTYPFLTHSQHSFVFSYLEEHGSLPMFFLLIQQLRASEMRSDQIYRMLHGVSGRFWTLAEIAEKVGLTIERIRQISVGTINIQTHLILKSPDWKSYSKLFSLPFICETTPEFIRLQRDEHIDIPFNSFAYILVLVAGFRVEEINKHAVLLNKNQLADFNLKDCIDTLQSFVNAKYDKDKYISIDTVLFTAPETKRNLIEGLVEYIATEIYKVKITPDKQIHIPQNHINTSEEVYDILAKRGRPMHVNEIFEEFKKKYPDHKYREPRQIKPSLYLNKHIKAVGKSSKYALDNWDGIFFGSIRDLLVDLLNSSDEPVHIDKLFSEVVAHYPDTNKASVFSTMFDATMQRFVAFEGGYFGLSSKKYPAKYRTTNGSRHYKFEERLKMLTDFVDNNHHFPSYKGSNEEASLQRWAYNVTNNIIDVSGEQKQNFIRIMDRYDKLGYPRTMQEYEFQMKCRTVKDYIREHKELPDHKTHPKLYAWLRRSNINHQKYLDKRRRYMEELLDFIASSGLSLERGDLSLF